MRLTTTLEFKHAALDGVITLTMRHPTTQELSDYMRDQYVMDGRQVVNRSPEARLALADKLLVNVSGLEFTTATHSVSTVGPTLELSAEDRSNWSQALGQDIHGWKDLIPPALKMGAILQLEMNGWVSPSGHGADREETKPGGPEAAPAVP